jgi:SAM-dependent methyltransferase
VTETDEYARAYFDEQRASNEEFWRRFGGAPQWRGRRVLEVGSGHGALSLEIARAGAAQVLGVDLDEFRIQFATHILAERYPELQTNVSFRAVDATSLPLDKPFDVIVSKDTFEHVADLTSLLKGLGRLLASGGIIYAGFSPLYYSPFGDHGRTGLRVPWAHAILPRRAVLTAATRRQGQEVRSLLDIGLNGYTPDQFRAAFDSSGLRVVDLAYNRGDKRLLKVLENARRRFPRLDRFTTVSMYATLSA